MTMNKTYRWARFFLCALPFVAIVAYMLNESATPLFTTASVTLNTITMWFRWQWLYSLLQSAFGGFIVFEEWNSWVLDLFTYYFMVWAIDLCVMLVTFIPRWIVNRFGGDLS